MVNAVEEQFSRSHSAGSALVQEALILVSELPAETGSHVAVPGLFQMWTGRKSDGRTLDFAITRLLA
jgi:hypothetical protein